MQERFETDPFKNKYTDLLEKLKRFHISESDFNDYMYILENDIEMEIKKAGRVPEYAYRMIIKEVIPYEYKEFVYLELFCGFEIIKEKKEDVTVVGPFIDDLTDRDGNLYIEYIEDLDDKTMEDGNMFPVSGNAVMNLGTGEHSASVNWQELYS
jgi:hypothetical protein